LKSFRKNRHIKVVRFSVLRTGRLYPAENIPGTQWVDAREQPAGLRQRHHRESNSQPSDLHCSASTN